MHKHCSENVRYTDYMITGKHVAQKPYYISGSISSTGLLILTEWFNIPPRKHGREQYNSFRSILNTHS